jgi:hypothetical protein
VAARVRAGVPTGVTVCLVCDRYLEIGQGLPHVYQLMLGTSEAAEPTGQIGKLLRARVL